MLQRQQEAPADTQAEVNEEGGKRVPQAGEVWQVSLDPTKGHEQAGYRPVVVLSVAGTNGPTKRFIVVPVTTSIAAPHTARAMMQVRLAGLPKPSAALPDQITTLDWQARVAKFMKLRVTEAELQEIRIRVKALCGIE